MPVPESVQKKLATKARLEAESRAVNVKASIKRKTLRSKAFVNAAKYEKEYADKAAREQRLTRAAKTAGDFYVPETPNLLAVIRCVELFAASAFHRCLRRT